VRSRYWLTSAVRRESDKRVAILPRVVLMDSANLVLRSDSSGNSRTRTANGGLQVSLERYSTRN
jgi:hypothetical protein